MARWTLTDLTEFELHLRRGGPVESTETTLVSRKDLFFAWLERQRVRDPEPGRRVGTLMRAERLLSAGLVFLALLSGLGAARALLWYDGTRLINVSRFLVVLVFGQMVLLLALPLIRLLFRSSLADLYQRLLQRLPELEDSRRLRSAWTLHGFVQLQAAAVAFNFAALAATAVEGITRDLGFGWGTTLNLGPEDVHRIVSVLARPWGGAWVPGPGDIAASRIVLIEGLGRVDAVSAASWWPFLLMCLLCYGLIPRLLLGLGGAWMLCRSLGRPDFTDPLSETLALRLTRHPLQMDATGARNERCPAAVSDIQPLPAFRPEGAVVLIASADCGGDALREPLRERLDLEIDRVVERPSSEITAAPPGGVVWVLEAWQPPIREHLEQLRQLRRDLGADTDLLVLLTGLPEEGGLLSPPAQEDTVIWSQALAGLRDPRLGLIPVKGS